MKHLNKKLFLMLIAGLFSIAQSAQATSTFSPSSTVTITIDSITNNTTSGDFSGLDIIGQFAFAFESQPATGDGTATSTYSGAGIDSTVSLVSAGDSFSQSFSANGSASNGDVNSHHEAYGDLAFTNNTSDSFTIQYSINYILDATVTSTSGPGNLATTSASLDYYNDLGDIYDSQLVSASSLLSLSDNINSTASFTLNLGAFGADTFYADVILDGFAQASPVPVPAAGWFMLSGLAFLRNFRTKAA